MLDPPSPASRDVRSEEPRLPLRVRVATRPPLPDCWSVNISATGMGLLARVDRASPPPRKGAVIDLAFRLPDGRGVTAKGTVMWVAAAGVGGVAAGVRFDAVPRLSEAALAGYLRGNRLRVAAAFATAEEQALLSGVLGAEGRLLCGATVDELRAIVERGDVSTVVVCGAEGPAAALVDTLSGSSEGVVPPRLLLAAPVPAPRLVQLFNERRVFRSLELPLEAGAVREAIQAACDDHRAQVEREHVALALVTERRREAGGPSQTRPLAGITFVMDAEMAANAQMLEFAPGVDSAAAERPTHHLRSPAAKGSPAPRRPEGLDRYVRTDVVAKGGMGVVLACQDGRLGRKVAIKLLHDHHLPRPELVHMLEREARVTGSLEHPNIIPVYDAGRSAEGAPYYVMRFIKDPTMGNAIERLRSGDREAATEYTLGRLLRHFVQVCRAVDYAHSRGVIHCDLKPANVLLGSFGEVLVVDWGLAFLPEEGTVFRGGTFGYVAPEQMELGGKIDARTDVYALGGILYELLCLQPPFPEDALYQDPVTKAPRHPRRLPRPPREVAPDRKVPEQLEEICLSALATERDARLPSAGQMAAAIEAFLEGTQERERRRRRAEEIVSHADSLAENYFEMMAARPERVAALEALRSSIAPWEPPDRKQPQWDAEDSLAVTDMLAVRTLQAAVSAYEQALDEVRDHAAARRGLARLYAAELKRAEDRRDEHNRTYFEELVKQYDDGTITEAARGGGLLTVEAAADALEVRLARLEEQGRRLVALSTKSVGRSPLSELLMAQGTYLITLHAPALPVLRFPVVIKPGTRLRVFADLAALADQRKDEILVPGGPAILGGDDTTLGGREAYEAQVGTFFIQERPVSFRDYLAFLKPVCERLGPERAAPLFPRHGQSAPFWRWAGGAFEPAEILQWGMARDELLDLPVFGVDLRCAEAYAEWLSRQTGKRYRLPTEDEWEKAARGTDGRRFPWGNHFDASFCCMRESTAEAPRPRRSGLFDADVSPFGVRDMGGGVADWVTPGRERARAGGKEVVSRGGSWSDWRIDCSVMARRPYLTTERSARVGFRLVREGPGSVGYAFG